MGSREPQSGGFKIRYIFYFVGVLLAILSIFSYSAQDAAAIYGGTDAPAQNWIGTVGAYFSYFLFNLLGLASYLIAILTAMRMFRALLPGNGRPWLSLSGEILIVTGVVLLLGIAPETFAAVTEKLGIGREGVPKLALAGGVVGQFFAGPLYEAHEGILRQLIGVVGITIFSWALLGAGIIVVYLSDWHKLLKSIFGIIPTEQVHNAFKNGLEPLTQKLLDSANNQDDEYDYDEEEEEEIKETKPSKGLFGMFKKTDKSQDNEDDLLKKLKKSPYIDDEDTPPPVRPQIVNQYVDNEEEKEDETPQSYQNYNDDEEDFEDDVSSQIQPPKNKSVANTIPKVSTREVEQGTKARSSIFRFTLPPITMLSKGVDAQGEDRESILKSRKILQDTLDSFKVPGTVSGYISGPRVTRYEISLEAGVKVKKVEELSDNIAMNLSAKSVRVLAPIPGRPVVGVETPNSKPEAVFMRSIMESELWQNGKAEIPIVLGKDVAGSPVILDLAKAPHLLIAGSTGSGKSVCMNTLITSLIFNFAPDELKLVMVDPKVVEFEDYRNLPHLITPVINDSRKVPVALRWAVNEMEKRYQILACAGVKKLSEFNARTLPATPQLDRDEMPIPDKMPILIVIIDELADLMMTEAKKDAETSITRIAQKGRAAGVHIVVATQRPSTNVITGIIKANLPTRVAFRVGQMIDSRVILDQNGAEKLLGMGDMLYMAPGGSDVERVQGAWVKDEDIKKIVHFVSEQAPQHFNSEVIAEVSEDDEEEDYNSKQSYNNNNDYDDDDDDFGLPDFGPIMQKYVRNSDPPNLKRAIEVVLVDKKISTSYLQRRLKIGYNQSAELIDILEDRGVVGPASGSGNKREILILNEIEGF